MHFGKKNSRPGSSAKEQNSVKTKAVGLTGRRRLIAIGAVGAAAVIAAVTINGTLHTDTASAATVKSATAETGNISTTISSTGTLQNDDDVSIEVPAGVKIKKVLVSSGDTVKKGQKLASVYQSSAASVLLTVNDNISTLNDAINDLDDADDTSSDDYLQALVYQEELKEQKALRSSLKSMIETGYITSAASGTIGDVNISGNTEVSASSGSSSTSGSSSASGSSSGTASASGTAAASGTTSTASGKLTASLLAASSSASDSDTSTGTEAADDSEAKKEITASNLSSFRITTPKAGASMQTAVSSSDYYTGKISWTCSGSKVSGKFKSGKTYTATITLTAKDGYQFSTDDSAYSAIQLGNATLIRVSSDGSSMTVQAAYVIPSSSASAGNSAGSSSSSGSSASASSGSQSGSSSSGSKSSSSASGSQGQSSNGSGNASSGSAKTASVSGTAGTSSGTSGSVSSGSSSSSSSESAASASDSTVSIASTDTVDAVTIASSDDMIVSVSVDEADINSVKTGQTASVTVSAVSDESFEGKITEVSSSSSSSDSSSVKYAVEITVDKESGMLEGMSASCVINVEEADNAVLIPSAAIQESKGSTYVYTSKDSEGNLTGKTKVSTGLSNGTQVQITSGLSEGDTVYYTVAESASSSDSTSSKADSSGGMRGGSMPSGGSAPSGNPGGNGGNKS